MNDCSSSPEGTVAPNVKFSGKTNFSNPLAKTAPKT